MERLAAAPLAASPALDTWARRRRRARQLAEQHPYAAELLRLYAALLDAQEPAFLRALGDRPGPPALARYVAERVMPDIVSATVAAGPPPLAAAAPERLRRGDASRLVTASLAGERQAPVDEYLARAASAPVLESLGPAAGAACTAQAGGVGCPRCGGLPQVSYLPEGGEALVSGPRMLQCCRCAHGFVHQRMTCAGCREETTSKLPIFADAERLPHLRADACETCRRYVITVDLRKDPHAVPEVDELVALPLDLYAQERGFSKITPNLMAIG